MAVACRAQSTSRRPTQITGANASPASPSAVPPSTTRTLSPTPIASTATAPRAVAIRVPAAKHGTTWSTSAPAVVAATVAAATLSNVSTPSVVAFAITATTEPFWLNVAATRVSTTIVSCAAKLSITPANPPISGSPRFGFASLVNPPVPLGGTSIVANWSIPTTSVRSCRRT